MMAQQQQDCSQLAGSNIQLDKGSGIPGIPVGLGLGLGSQWFGIVDYKIQWHIAMPAPKRIPSGTSSRPRPWTPAPSTPGPAAFLYFLCQSACTSIATPEWGSATATAMRFAMGLFM